MPAVTNQSDVDLFRRLAAYFQTGTWTYLYPRLAGSQAFLQNLNNSSGILYAYDTLGDPMYSLNYNGDNSMLIWYYTAFYANLYPLPDILQANCLQFQTYIASIENSIAASDKQYVADNNGPQHVARTIVLSNMLNQYNSYYAGLSCDTYLADQAKAEAAAANQAAVNSATQGQLAAYTATQGTTVLGIPLTTANIGIVAIVAVGIILGVVYFKKNANKMASQAVINGMLSFAKKYGVDMIAALNNSPIFFAVMLVQGSNESGYGTSYSAVHRNNFFGIMEGKKKRVFNTPQDCFAFYANLLTSSPVYVNAGVTTATDPYAQMRAIANAGYYDANTDDTLPVSQKTPNKIWTAQQSADHYFSTNKIFLDGILLSVKIGRINSSTIAQAKTSLVNITSLV